MCGCCIGRASYPQSRPHTVHLRATNVAGNVSSLDVSFTLDTLSPALLSFVMTGAYHAFPDSAPKDGDGEGISTEGAAMAYLMRGVHF